MEDRQPTQNIQQLLDQDIARASSNLLKAQGTKLHGGTLTDHWGDQRSKMTPGQLELLSKEAKKCEKLMGKPEVNFNVLPGEIILYCPYYKNHFFRDSRAHIHLSNCRRQYIQERKKVGQPIDINVCPHFHKHHVPLNEWDHHLKQCEIIAAREIESIKKSVKEEANGLQEYKVPGTGDVITRSIGDSHDSASNLATRLMKTEDDDSASFHDYKAKNKKDTEGCWDDEIEKEEAATRRDKTIAEALLSAVTNKEVPKTTVVNNICGDPWNLNKPQKSGSTGTKVAGNSGVFAYNFMKKQTEFQSRTQPPGLTKSERKAWQLGNLARVKEEMEAEKVRKLRLLTQGLKENEDGQCVPIAKK